MTPTARRGLMLVMSSPSGAGKTTLTRRLLAEDDQVAMSVSATTRPPRPGEVDGRDYFFMTAADFAAKEEEGEFLESATVFGNSYGTPKTPVFDALKAGQDVLFDIDWQGTQQLTQKAHEDLVRVFILPPSIEELERRLRGRAQDPEDVVQKRMAQAAAEISHWAEYDYVIVNVDIEDSLAQLKQILTVERSRRSRQPWLVPFVRELMKPRD